MKSVVYTVPDKMGGMLGIVANLLAHRRPDAFVHRAVLTHCALDTDTRFAGTLAADAQVTVEHRMPRENLYAALARVSRAIGPEPGVLVTADWIELAAAAYRDPGKAVIQVLHGDHDYYYDLARRNEAVIDAWVAYSRAMYENLRELLPHRREQIFNLPYGIPLPTRVRQRPLAASGSGPLRLVYAGRLDQGQKVVFDLPSIDAGLARRGIRVAWTVIGGGPDEAELRRRWQEAAGERFGEIRWLGVLENREVIEHLAEADVFVLPSRAEGLPVALLEAMGAGLVPVVSDIESGVSEVVEPGITGFREPQGEPEAFAAAIARLAGEPELLETISQAARERVAAGFDIERRAADYQALYARYAELRRPRPSTLPVPCGSRLDRPWLPNAPVRLARTLAHHLWGAR